jgi:ribosomal protein S18 acetylase RimI-like enzyme
MAENLPLEIDQASIPPPDVWRAAFPYVLYEEDRPVSTASVFVGDGFLYLAMVATLPEARRKGYAAAIAQHSLQKAYEATGITRMMLHSKKGATLIYTRLGYRAIAQFTKYHNH